LENVKSCLGNQQLDLSKRFSVCTDGAPSMIGKAAGAGALLQRLFGHPLLKSLHYLPKLSVWKSFEFAACYGTSCKVGEQN